MLIFVKNPLDVHSGTLKCCGIHLLNVPLEFFHTLLIFKFIYNRNEFPVAKLIIIIDTKMHSEINNLIYFVKFRASKFDLSLKFIDS